MEQLLYFMLTYQNYIFLAMFGALALVAFVNFVHNPYAMQNAKLKRFNKKTLQKPSCIVLNIRHLPQEYQRQWRAYVNCGCQKPSVVFEFVKLPKRYLLWFVHFVSVVICVGYVYIASVLSLPHLIATQVTFLLASVLVVLINKFIGQINICCARKIFGKFLHDLNTVAEIVKCEQSPTQQPSITQCTAMQNCPQTAVAEQANAITQSNANVQPQSDNVDLPQTPTTLSQDIVDKAVSTLRQKGLDNPRTAEEQRKLNIALNNLLQACCKKKA